MKITSKTLIISTTSALLLVMHASAQQKITAVTTVSQAATASSYTAGGYSYNFGSGSIGDLQLTGVTLGSTNFNVASNLPTQIQIRRNPTTSIPNERQIIWYQTASTSGTTRNLSATQVLGMETALSQSIINRGTDNVFTNTGNSSGNNNNIERIDFIFNSQYLSPQNASQLNGVGFSVLERGGNDTFMIAAITSLDASGNPAGYASAVSIATTDWGTGLWTGSTTVLQGQNVGLNSYVRTADTGSTQSVQGIFFSLQNLGITAQQSVYGYSLFAADTATA